MILLTGATGTVGGALLPKLLERGDEVRVLVRDARRLGRHRVDVRITLGDLAELRDPHLRRQALRGVETVIHLAATIRDQPHAPVEELNGLATARLLRGAEDAGVDRFLFFSALGATEFQRTRFFRAKALAERAVAESPAGDDGPGALDRLRPRRPLGDDDAAPGAAARWCRFRARGRAAYQPIWAADAASCVLAVLDRDATARSRRARRPRDAQLRADGAHDRRRRRHGTGRSSTCHSGSSTPASWGCAGSVGEAAFATWEEAELFEVPMTSARGDADVREARDRTAADARGARRAVALTQATRTVSPPAALASYSARSARA